jgi:hypothetical protein
MLFGRRIFCILLFILTLGRAALAADAVPVASGISDAKQPRVAVTPKGDVLVVFGAGENVYLSISHDQGASFESPRQIATIPGLMLGLRRGPRIAATKEDIVVTAQGTGELYSTHSSDGGLKWSTPLPINDDAGSAREGLHGLAAGLNGHFYVSWIDGRTGKAEVYGAASLDGGKSWQKNELIYHSPSGAVCECCHPSVVINPTGEIAVLWRNLVKGSRDMWMATRAADKDEFNYKKLGLGSWVLDACPMDGGDLFTFGPINYGAVWRRGDLIYLNVITPEEFPLGGGTQPFAAAAGPAIHIFWQKDGNLLHKVSREQKPEILARDAEFGAACVAADFRSIFVVYESTAGGARQPMFKAVPSGVPLPTKK